MTEAFSSGTLAGAGTFRCETCGFALTLQALDPLPSCAECDGDRFRRGLLSEPVERPARGHDPTLPGWALHERAALHDVPGDYLVYAGETGSRVVPLGAGWTRVGRSLAADLRFDDPTVSRRHALFHCERGATARVLDDRSLNGVFRNGERVDMARLEDGDEITIGRFTLFFLHVDAPTGSGARAAGASAAR